MGNSLARPSLRATCSTASWKSAPVGASSGSHSTAALDIAGQRSDSAGNPRSLIHARSGTSASVGSQWPSAVAAAPRSWRWMGGEAPEPRGRLRISVSGADPPVGVAEEERAARPPRTVLAACVPQAAVEDHRGARGRQDLDRAGGWREPLRWVVGSRQPVSAVAPRDHLEVPATGSRDVGEKPRDLDREPRAGVALDLEILAAAVLVPPPRWRAVGGSRRMDVEVAVVDVHVPAQRGADQVEHARLVDQGREPRLALDESERVDGAVARRAFAPADSLGQRPQAADLGRRQRIGEDDVAVALEAGRGRWDRMACVRIRPPRQRRPGRV